MKKTRSKKSLDTVPLKGSSHRRKSATCPTFVMVCLNRWPIPVGRRGVISSFN
jgi:hypothetical protein